MFKIFFIKKILSSYLVRVGESSVIWSTHLNQSINIWSEWRLTVIAATVRIALVDILDLSEVDIPAGGFLYPAVGWG